MSCTDTFLSPDAESPITATSNIPSGAIPVGIGYGKGVEPSTVTITDGSFGLVGGSTITWASGNMSIGHASGTITVSGGALVVSAPIGFAGNVFDARFNNNSMFRVSAAGDAQVTGALNSSGGVNSRFTLTTPAGGGAACYTMGAAGIGEYFGSGNPAITAPVGSRYVNTSPTGANDRYFISTGAGTWTAILCAS